MSTLHLIDLARLESVRHTESNGDRQKKEVELTEGEYISLTQFF